MSGNRALRVLLIAPLPPPLGGTTIMFKRLVDILSERDGIEVIILDTSRPNRNFIANFMRGVNILLRLLWLTPQVDIISFHASALGTFCFGPVVWLVSKLFRKKSVLREFGGVLDRRYEQLGLVTKWVVRNTALNMDLLLFETKNLVEKFRRITSSSIAWFPNNRPLLGGKPPMPSRMIEGAKKFVFAGHVKPTKGVREIVEAADSIEEEFIVHIYGPLMDGMTRDDFHSEKVTYKGILPSEEVPNTLRQYDVLLLPTYHSGEGYPGVILESYSVGVPVIGTNWYSIPEIVDQESGILVEPRNVESLKKAMVHLIRSPQELARLRVGACKKAKEFSSAYWVDQFVGLVSSLLDDYTRS